MSLKSLWEGFVQFFEGGGLRSSSDWEPSVCPRCRVTYHAEFCGCHGDPSESIASQSSGAQGLRSEIKKLESQGWTGRTNSRLDALNRAQTNALSTGGIRSLISSREAQGLPTGKLRAALSLREDD